MKLFKFIRESLSHIGFKANYTPTNSISIPETVKEQDHRAIKERVRKAFEQQEKEMKMRAFKQHSASCPDNWTCRADPCFIIEPDKIVKHKKGCVHYNGIIPGEPICECNRGRETIKDFDLWKANGCAPFKKPKRANKDKIKDKDFVK